MPESAPTIYPVMSYRDARAAIEFLVEAFGFETLFETEGENGQIVHAELRLGNGVIMLGTAKEKPLSPGVYAVVDDVDEHFAQAEAAGAETIYEPRDTDYGSREYGARDPEGHAWYFGTYAPKLPD